VRLVDPDREALLARIGAVRRRLARDGPPRTRGPAGDFERISLPEPDCDALRDTLIAERAATVIEIGLAYGSSALAIGEALVSAAAGEPRHIIVDAFQQTVWSNAGWQLIQEAGLGPFTRLVTERSQLYLPNLVTEGSVADAAFVDGSHLFHEVFVDLYFLRRLVRPGGLVIVDDVAWPSVATAVRYYQTNTGWRPVASRGRAQAYRLPDPPAEPSFEDFKPF
jgi:predicted O-methyltransferase YrrM